MIVHRLRQECERHLRARATTAKLFTEVCRQHPDRPAIISVETGAVLTFRDVENLSNQVANYLLSQGFQEGDRVALFMNNCPEYIKEK